MKKYKSESVVYAVPVEWFSSTGVKPTREMAVSSKFTQEHLEQTATQKPVKFIRFYRVYKNCLPQNHII